MTGTRRSTLKVNKRRKGALSFVGPWLKRFGIALIILIGGFWLGAWYLFSGNMGRTQNWIDSRTVAAGADMGFKVRNIMVEGRVYTDPEILKAMINIEKGDPLFAFDPDKTRTQIKKINWVKDARVERRLPDTIYIGLQEKKPLVLWQKAGSLELIDEDGNPITKENLGRFKNLLIVMGDEAPSHAPELMKDLNAEPLIVQQLKAAKWMGDRRWDLVFDNNVTAKLPEKEPGLALRKLAQAIEMEGLLKKNIVSIDLREDGRMIVQTAPGAEQDYQASSKTGNNI